MTGIHRYFGHLADDRQSGKVDYPLITIITIVLLGTLCGCEGWLEISEWADFRRDWLATFLELGPEGLTPCETTLACLAGSNPGRFATRSSLGHRRSTPPRPAIKAASPSMAKPYARR